MRRGSKRRAWLATSFAVVGLTLSLLTLVWGDWIELLFGADPDQHSGALELLVSGAFLGASALLAGLARRDWRNYGSTGSIGSASRELVGSLEGFDSPQGV